MLGHGPLGSYPLASSPDEKDPAKLHAKMLSHIAALENRIEQLAALPPSTGHNFPPEAIEGELSFSDQRDAIDTALAVLSSQPPVPSEKPTEAEEATKKLAESVRRIGAYLGQKADVFVNEVAKGAGQEAGKRIAQAPFWLALYFEVSKVLEAAISWLHALPK